MRKVIAATAVIGVLLAGCSTGEVEEVATPTTTEPSRPTADWKTIEDVTAAIQYATESCENAAEDGDMGACGTSGGVIQYAINSPDGEDVALHLRIISLQSDRANDEVVIWDDGWTIHCGDDTASDCDLIDAEYPGGKFVDLEAGEGMDVQGELDKVENGIQDGIRLVGSEIQPGTYKYDGSSGSCYWARLSGLGGTSDDIIANGNEQAQVYVTIDASDVAFESRRCGMWEKVE